MRRIFFVLICCFILLSTVGCSTSPVEPPISDTVGMQPTPPIEPSVTDAVGTQPTLPTKSFEEQRLLYDDIIAQYTSLLTAKQKGKVLPVPNTANMSQDEIAISDALYGIVSECKDAQSAENLGYGYKDLDGNGTLELMILTKYTSLRAIFTISGDAPILLEANYKTGSSFVFAAKNRFFMVRSTVNENLEETTFFTCRVAGAQMAYDEIYGKVYDQNKKQTVEKFRMENGNRIGITDDVFNELYSGYRKTTAPGYSVTTKLLTPRIHYPLKKNTANGSLPKADFSSYGAIRETYKKLSSCLEQFDSNKWARGEYDNLFTVSDDLTFEYYARLLYAAYHGAYGVGYDELDLNGDGQDELVLLNEDYRIKAIFTQKEGVPVLLDAFAYETCWLDDQGRIHVDNEQYDELEYRLYEFTKNGDYQLIYSILAAENGNRYLTKDGKTEKITFEKSLELYHDDYCRYSEPFQPYEQTRNVSAITYTPLVPSTEDRISAAVAQTWHKYANLEKTVDSGLAYSNTYLSFENVTETQMTLSLRYVFTFYYPDPDRDHFLLEDSTESTFKITAHKENGVFVFDENGIKGKLEFGQKCLWLVIDESTDRSFSVGHHCYEKYSPQDFIS